MPERCLGSFIIAFVHAHVHYRDGSNVWAGGACFHSNGLLCSFSSKIAWEQVGFPRVDERDSPLVWELQVART